VIEPASDRPAGRAWAEARATMTSKEADRKFARLSRDEKDDRATSKSRSIIEAAKADRDLKTARLRKQHEAKRLESAKGA
jgi:hypothetical protein